MLIDLNLLKRNIYDINTVLFLYSRYFLLFCCNIA